MKIRWPWHKSKEDNEMIIDRSEPEEPEEPTPTDPEPPEEPKEDGS